MLFHYGEHLVFVEISIVVTNKGQFDIRHLEGDKLVSKAACEKL